LGGIFIFERYGDFSFAVDLFLQRDVIHFGSAISERDQSGNIKQKVMLIPALPLIMELYMSVVAIRVFTP